MFPLLLSVDDLNSALHDSSLQPQLVLVDIGKQARFEQAHIPGARCITPAETQAGSPVPGLAPESESLAHLLSRIGTAPDSHLVIYDDEGGGWAGRFIWLLDEIGFHNYSYLDGGLVAWKQKGFAVATGTVQDADASRFQVSPSGKYTITWQSLLEALKEKKYTIWDARSPEEYRGEKVHAARGGHIPGAINYNWTDAMDAGNGLCLRPLNDIKAELSALGISGQKTIVTHCQSHHRSGLTYLICKLLGYPALAYAGSWGEWGNLPDTPVEHA